jgi:hypothetical protein
VRITAIVTQLVFEHALRIRVKAGTSSSPGTTPAVTPEAHSDATTPDNVSVADNDLSETVGGSGEENRQSTTSSSNKGKQKDLLAASMAHDDSSEDPGKSSNLVGKMNNLVSTDLENLIEGRDFLLIGPLFVYLSQMPLMSLSPTLRFISSSSGCCMHLVLTRHPRLECICRVHSYGRPLSCPWPPCKEDPDNPE